MNENAHARAQDAFSAYLEGDLDPEQKRSVDQHLGVCIQCRTELERFRSTIGRLGDLRAKAPRSLLPDIQQQIHRRSHGRFFGRRWLLFGRIPFEWVSLAMIVVMLVYYIVSSQSSPTTVSPAP
jgi:predicted anti-sigma-YlaC factor YlaD